MALTRAKVFLMINCPPVGGKQVLASNLILDGIEDLANNQSEGQAIEISEDYDELVKYSIGMIDSMNTNQTPYPIINYRTYRSSGWREKIALRKKGGLFLTEEGKQKKAKINYGILVHEILERIQNQAEAKSLINQYYLRGEISNKDKQVLLNQLEQIFSCPQVKSWFNTDWKVKVESSIIIQNQHPKRPDRVLIKGSNAIIIDFKTGIEKPLDTIQILSYKETLANMGYREIQAFLLYTANNKVVQVV